MGEKKAPATDRLTRASGSNIPARPSYNEDVELPEFLCPENELNTVQAMSYPCHEFLVATGLSEQFHNLVHNAGLTHLITREVQQYPKLTYYFVKWFKFNDGIRPTIEFRIYDEVKVMSLADFCSILGVRNEGDTHKIMEQPNDLKALYASLCYGDTRSIQRGKLRSIQFLYIRYFAFYFSRGVLARANTSNISFPDLAILSAALEGS